MPDYLVTITRRMTIFGARGAEEAVETALADEDKPTATQVRLGALALRIEVEKWEAERIIGE